MGPDMGRVLFSENQSHLWKSGESAQETIVTFDHLFGRLSIRADTIMEVACQAFSGEMVMHEFYTRYNQQAREIKARYGEAT
jgi:hypothetical protein